MRKFLFFIFGNLFVLLSLFAYVKASEDKFIVIGNGPRIRLFDLKGNFKTSFFIPQNYSENLNLATGDVDGDGKDEIVVVQNGSRGSQIKIFTEKGILKYPDFKIPDFYKSADVALGDLDGNEKKEIIIAGRSKVQIFDHLGTSILNFPVFSKNFRGQLRVASGDIDGDGKDEIVVSVGQGGRSHVRIFDRIGKLKPFQFFPFSKDFRGGVDIALGDTDGDGRNEIAMCQLRNGSWCKIYRYDNKKTILSEWQAYENYFGGVHVDMADINRDGKTEILVGVVKYDCLHIRAFAQNKKIVLDTKFFTYGKRRTEKFWSEISLSPGENFWFGARQYHNGIDVALYSRSNRDEAKVVYVEDGDTVFLDDGRKIRYIGIDTPEVGEPFYLEATNKNKALVLKKRVTLEYDRQKIDPYGRILAYVFVDGKQVNKELLKEGYAKVKIFPPNVKYRESFQEIEALAQKNHKGIWNSKEKLSDNLSKRKFIEQFLMGLARTALNLLAFWGTVP